jgi:hypothetical protein
MIGISPRSSFQYSRHQEDFIVDVQSQKSFDSADVDGETGTASG